MIRKNQIRAFYILLSLFILSACDSSSVSGDYYFFVKISQYIGDEKTEILIAELIDIDWDRVCMFDYGGDLILDINTPGSITGIVTPISTKFDKRLKNIKNTSDITIFIFVHEGELVNIVIHNSKKIKAGNKLYKFNLDKSRCLDRASESLLLIDGEKIIFTEKGKGN